MATYRITYHPNSSQAEEEVEAIGYDVKGDWISFYSEPGHLTFRVKSEAAQGGRNGQVTRSPSQ